jgi:hypothetical protein
VQCNVLLSVNVQSNGNAFTMYVTRMYKIRDLLTAMPNVLLNVEPAATIADTKTKTIKNRSSNGIDEESQIQNANDKIIRPMNIMNNIVI